MELILSYMYRGEINVEESGIVTIRIRISKLMPVRIRIDIRTMPILMRIPPPSLTHVENHNFIFNFSHSIATLNFFTIFYLSTLL
jgi:hypothetical protein